MEKKEIQLKRLYVNIGEKSPDIKIEDLFPDLPHAITEIIENDILKKEEIKAWVDSEVKGAQFNAIRLCCIPSEDDLQPNKYNDDLCESYKICPLYNQGHAPVGKLCALEKFKVSRITHELVEELKIDIFSDYTDKYIIGELVTYSLIEDRAARALAATSLGFTSITLGRNGKEYKKAKSFYIDIINEMRRAKADARKALIATRDEKLKSQKNIEGDDKKEAYDELVKMIENRNNKPNKGLLIDIDALAEDVKK